jgi:transcriptional regulator with XRE-family HTH domain
MNSPLTQYRTANGISIESLAETLGVERTTVWRWERGRVPVDRLPDVEKATGIPRSELRPDIFGDAQ